MTFFISTGLDALADAPRDKVADPIIARTPAMNIGRASRSIMLFLAIMSPIGIEVIPNTIHCLGHWASQAFESLLIPYKGEWISEAACEFQLR